VERTRAWSAHERGAHTSAHPLCGCTPRATPKLALLAYTQHADAHGTPLVCCQQHFCTVLYAALDLCQVYVCGTGRLQGSCEARTSAELLPRRSRCLQSPGHPVSYHGLFRRRPLPYCLLRSVRQCYFLFFNFLPVLAHALALHICARSLAACVCVSATHTHTHTHTHMHAYIYPGQHTRAHEGRRTRAIWCLNFGPSCHHSHSVFHSPCPSSIVSWSPRRPLSQLFLFHLEEGGDFAAHRDNAVP
jgi:hypothetical protein